MDKEMRADLIRQRFKAKGGIAYVPNPARKPRREAPHRGVCIRYSFPMPIEGSTGRSCPERWIVTPDARSKGELAPRRTKRTSPLLKLAALYPIRLPRR